MDDGYGPLGLVIITSATIIVLARSAFGPRNLRGPKATDAFTSLFLALFSARSESHAGGER